MNTAPVRPTVSSTAADFAPASSISVTSAVRIASAIPAASATTVASDTPEPSVEVFGDSVLKGVMYINNRYKLYRHTLEDRLLGEGIALHRNCKMGATVESGLERLKAFFEKAPTAPKTTVLLEYGGNDCAYDWKKISADPEGSHLPVTGKETFEARYQEAIDLCRSHGVSVVLSTLVPIDAEKYLSFISRDLDRMSILRWLGDTSMLYRWHESYNGIVERLARRNALPLLDLRERFLLSHDFKALLCDDGIHPTEQGHALLDDELHTLIVQN